VGRPPTLSVMRYFVQARRSSWSPAIFTRRRLAPRRWSWSSCIASQLKTRRS
jgi:hypothetical protein